MLDLTKWSFSDLTPNGNAPIMCTNTTSWAHKEKIYVFGGNWRGDIGIPDALNYPTGQHEIITGDRNATNQLFCYNTITNSFEQPFGDRDFLGPPRYGHSSFLHGNVVFVFGGLDTDIRLKNELLMIDLDTKDVKQIHGDTRGEDMPWGRAFHSLTKTSSGKAILYGGFGGSLDYGLAVRDCWILHTERILSGKFTQPSELWSKVETLEELEPRFGHSAIIDPQSERLYVFGGGFWGKYRNWMPSTRIQVISFTTAPLELLAMERVIARYGAEDQDLDEFLPKDHPIRKTLEARRQSGNLEHMVSIGWGKNRQEETTRQMSVNETHYNYE